MPRSKAYFNRMLNKVRHHIESCYSIGEQLPSYRRFAEMFDITVNMTFRIICELGREGVVRFRNDHRVRGGDKSNAATASSAKPVRIGLISSQKGFEWNNHPIYSALTEESNRREISIVPVHHPHAYRPTAERRRLQWSKIPWNTFDVGLLLQVEDYLSLSDPERGSHPVIAVDADATFFGVDSVAFNNFNAGWQAADYLFKRGHRRFGVTVECTFTNSYPRDTALAQRRHGFELGIGFYGAIFRNDWYMGFHHGDNDRILRNLIRRWLEMWHATKDRPTAIFDVHHHVEAITSECARLNIEIPRDLSIVTVADCDEKTHKGGIRFTYFRADYNVMARCAMDAAQQIFDGKPRITSSVLLSNEGKAARLFSVPMSLVSGNSVREI